MLKRYPEFFESYYIRISTRLPSYLVGILLGWILQRTKNVPFTIKKVSFHEQILMRISFLLLVDSFFFLKLNVAISWLLAGLILSTMIYSPVPYVDEIAVPAINPLFELLYGTFHRTLWSASVPWIIFLCANGYGGTI